MLRSPGIGPVSYFELLRRFGNASAALDALPYLGARGGRKYRPVSAERIEAEIERLHRAGAPYLFHSAPAYPRLLAAPPPPPPLLTWRGDLSLRGQGVVALMGARNASARACRHARA